MNLNSNSNLNWCKSSHRSHHTHATSPPRAHTHSHTLPHTHSRALNTLAVAAFAAGVAAAYSAELLEDWAAGEPAHGGDADHAAWRLASHMLAAGTATKPARALAPEPFLRW